jgi:hypothetical protein
VLFVFSHMWASLLAWKPLCSDFTVTASPSPRSPSPKADPERSGLYRASLVLQCVKHPSHVHCAPDTPSHPPNRGCTVLHFNMQALRMRG